MYTLEIEMTGGPYDTTATMSYSSEEVAIKWFDVYSSKDGVGSVTLKDPEGKVIKTS